MSLVADTYRQLCAALVEQQRKVVMYSCSGGKKRYLHVERQAEDAVTVTIFSNEIIYSTPTQLVVSNYGYKTGSTREAFEWAMFRGVVGSQGKDKPWYIIVDGQRRDFIDGMKLRVPKPWIPARKIREGDKLDLEGDPFAMALCDNDECDECPSRQVTIENELCEVVSVERETADCVRIDFESFSVGFPPDHLLNVEERATVQSRDYIDPGPEVEVDSPFGTLWLRALGRDVVAVDANHNGRTCRINNVELHLNGFWYRQSDGSWDTVPPGPDRVSNFSLNRKEYKSFNQRDGSTAQYRKAREVIGPLVAEWVTTPIGQHWTEHAAIAQINNRARIIEDDIRRLEDEADIKRRELASLLGADTASMEESLR